MNYDEQLDLVSSLSDYTEDADEVEALEAAIEAMTFVQALHGSLRDNGAQIAEYPDTDEVGTAVDCILGELSAASLFLSEASFARVPEMLRTISKALETQNAEPFTDTQGDSTPPVPAVVIQGFQHFADRLEATKVQKQKAINALKKVGV